jgi:hypothetical protein
MRSLGFCSLWVEAKTDLSGCVYLTYPEWPEGVVEVEDDE